MSVALLCLPTGINFSSYVPKFKSSNNYENGTTFDTDLGPKHELAVKTAKLMHIDSNLNLQGMGSSTSSLNSPQMSKRY